RLRTIELRKSWMVFLSPFAGFFGLFAASLLAEGIGPIGFLLLFGTIIVFIAWARTVTNAVSTGIMASLAELARIGDSRALSPLIESINPFGGFWATAWDLRPVDRYNKAEVSSFEVRKTLCDTRTHQWLSGPNKAAISKTAVRLLSTYDPEPGAEITPT